MVITSVFYLRLRPPPQQLFPCPHFCIDLCVEYIIARFSFNPYIFLICYEIFVVCFILKTPTLFCLPTNKYWTWQIFCTFVKWSKIICSSVAHAVVIVLILSSWKVNPRGRLWGGGRTLNCLYYVRIHTPWFGICLAVQKCKHRFVLPSLSHLLD